MIVEVGSLYGLCSWHLAKHCAPSVTLFCIDPWERRPWIIEQVEEPQKAPPFSRAAFEEYTADCDNIVGLYRATARRSQEVGICLLIFTSRTRFTQTQPWL